jgi:hypothetical protein
LPETGNISAISNYSLTNIVVDDYALVGGGITNLEILKSNAPTLGNVVKVGGTVIFNADPGYPTTTVLGSVIDNDPVWSVPVSTSWVNGLSVPPTTWNFSGSDTATWVFESNGYLTLPAGGQIVSAANTGNVVINASDGVQRTWTFEGGGNLTLPTSGTISYAPSTPSDWASPAPTSIEAALDRLAAVVKVLNGGIGA